MQDRAYLHDLGYSVTYCHRKSALSFKKGLNHTAWISKTVNVGDKTTLNSDNSNKRGLRNMRRAMYTINPNYNRVIKERIVK